MPDTPSPSRPRRGRPDPAQPRLSREAILAAARQVRDGGGGPVGMRSTAAVLGVDPMALYHYFPNKQALLDALVAQAFAPLDELPRRLARLPPGVARLRELADAYLRCVLSAPQVTRELAREGGGVVADQFMALLACALDGAGRPACELSAVQDVLVDYLHGVALAGPQEARAALDRGWPVLMDGLRSRLG